jgi:hypothetical protein
MLNPDDNLYSVAPIGQVIVIGRQMALKGGIMRENAINLLTWLILSTNATPDEIRAAILKANKPTVRLGATVGIGAQAVAKIVPAKIQVPIGGQSVAAFMGEIDPEEQAALDDVKAACDLAAQATQTAIATTPVEPVATVRTAAPVPITPARNITTPIVQPVAVSVPGTVPRIATEETVDGDKIAKAWGASS